MTAGKSNVSTNSGTRDSIEIYLDGDDDGLGLADDEEDGELLVAVPAGLSTLDAAALKAEST